MSYTVKQGTFEGPLDLLLELIEQEKLSINEISLARVTDEFIAYFRGLEQSGQFDPQVLAEFLVVASQLLVIKSRSLLPELASSAEEEASVGELEARLREYQRIREIAAELGARAAGGPKSFSREAYAGAQVIFAPPRSLIPSGLAEAFAAVLAAIPKAAVLAEEKLEKILSLEEKVRELGALLQERVSRAFSELVAGAREKIEVIVSFLAILEMAKQRLVAVEQHAPFGDITVRRVDPEQP